jgi:hypothetical protein
MYITTAGRVNSHLVAKAKQLSTEYNYPYLERKGNSIRKLKEKYQDNIIIVGKERLVVSPLNSEMDMFFHPNLAFIRAKRLLKGELDPLISASKLSKGMSFLDCTLGLASDSIVASLVVGPNGKVTGIEGNELVYLLVKEGLSTLTTKNTEFDLAMRNVQVLHEEHLNFLQNTEDKSYDVVYFDPMFQEGIEESCGINIIREQAISSELTQEILTEAKRVARERIVLKDHWKSKRFQDLGFTQLKRKTSLFHYGMLELHD